MSVVVWDGKTLAADRQVSDGSMVRTTTKIRAIKTGRFKGYLMGAVGATATANLMMDWFETGAKPEFFPYEYAKSAEMGASLIVITQKKEIWRFDHLPVPIIMEDDEYATGSGRDFAYGAMSMGADATKACEVACTHSTECGVAIDVIQWRKVNARTRPEGKADKTGAKNGRARKTATPSKRTAKSTGKAIALVTKLGGGRVR
jgi:ATP-dependent protease HslVU (ClpYQ) peptidase subunit